MRSVLETIQDGAGYLAKGGVESPRMNMEQLLAHVLGCNRMQLYIDFDRPLGEGELAPLRELVKRRRDGEPLQHLLGSVQFYGREFRCDRRALVPRPETEELVDRVLDRCAGDGCGPLRALDMGCGSGVIGLTLAAELGARASGVTLVDLSADALALAEENRSVAAGGAPVRFVQSDLFGSVGGGVFDLAVANLPYVPTAEVAGLAREVRRDPALALDGGRAGDEVIARFVDALPGRIAEGGLVALEIGSGQGSAVAARLRAHGATGVSVESDISGAERFVFARMAAAASRDGDGEGEGG
jgi:release factor glutamine methyltransferase